MKKKLVLGIVLMLILTAILLSVNVSAHDEEDPDTRNLWAGKNILAGYVHIYNDDDTLYVGIETIDGWELKESHVAMSVVP